MTNAPVLTTRAELLSYVSSIRARGESLALVPTMGSLHEGHLSLVRAGKQRCGRVAVTIFVNPTQFGPSEDLARYPRDLAGDVAKCSHAGADFIWAPPPEEVYRDGFQTWVEVERLSVPLCGALRPGHFRGVATIVCKLLSLFRPDLALFGEKDFQQLAVIRQMARDLELDATTEILGRPIVREPDGLAMSSRNAFLSADERGRALSLSRGLDAAERAVRAGERQAGAIVKVCRSELDPSTDRMDYVELVDAVTLQPIERLDRPGCLLIAAWLGKTRLIDNRVLAP